MASWQISCTNTFSYQCTCGLERPPGPGKVAAICEKLLIDTYEIKLYGTMSMMSFWLNESMIAMLYESAIVAFVYQIQGSGEIRCKMNDVAKRLRAKSRLCSNERPLYFRAVIKLLLA